MKQSVFVIRNMDCPTEEALIRKRLGTVPGIDDLAFNLMERRLTVSHTLRDEQPILGALRDLNYHTGENSVALDTPGPHQPKSLGHSSAHFCSIV